MQTTVSQFIAKYNLSCTEQTRYIDLVSEVGELGKEILKGCEYGKAEYRPTPNSEIELGDCLFSLLALCSEMNIDAEDALNKAISKYENRFTQKGHISSEA